MYDWIRKEISNVLKDNIPDAVLFSGGVDSSAVLYESMKYNKDVIAITIGVKGKECLDIDYSTKVASELNAKHYIYYADEQEIYDAVEEAIKILKTFSPEWISSTVTLMLGIKCAQGLGLKNIATGEGADDLFGSFPFFTEFKGNKHELNYIIEKRIDDIKIMTEEISKYYGINCILPYRNNHVRERILSIPIDERMLKTQNIKTKYPLRIAYKNFLPEISIIRPQTMAFNGSGVYNVIKSLEQNVKDEEYLNAKKIIDFKSKIEYYLYNLYIKRFEFTQAKENGCVHCKSLIKKNSVNCRICSTIQYNNKELSFNG